MNKLFLQIDNIPLLLWRIIFGLILFFETAGAIAVGWVKEVFIDPPIFTFNFIGFDFLQVFIGGWEYTMYVYFAVLALLSIPIVLGYHYRVAMLLFTLGWLGTYFMHKTSYNNHHYLMSVLCVMMCFIPAHRGYSLDAKRNPAIASHTAPFIYQLGLVLLLLIVFIYASGAKIYPDWIASGKPISQWIEHKTKDPYIGWLYPGAKPGVLMAWGGIIFDLLIIPAFLFKPTRKLALIASVFFHIMNSITFQIGTFPYMMIGSAVLLWPPQQLKKFFKLKPIVSDQKFVFSHLGMKFATIVFVLFIAANILLPMRHLLFKSNVFWSEEGHKLSWRMMLRAKTGYAFFEIHKPDGTKLTHNAQEDLTKEQYNTMCTHPDMIWQYCQYLKKVYGSDIKIFVKNNVSLNFRNAQPMIDPQYDMAKAEWHLFKTEEWITAGPEWENK